MIGMFAGLMAAPLSPGLALVIALVAGAVGAGLVGFAFERTVIAPLRGRDVLMTLIGTLGVAIMLQNGMALIAGPDPVPYPALLPRRFIDIGPVALTLRQIANFAVCLVLLGLVSFYVRADLASAGRRGLSPNGRTSRPHSG